MRRWREPLSGACSCLLCSPCLSFPRRTSSCTCADGPCREESMRHSFSSTLVAVATVLLAPGSGQAQDVQRLSLKEAEEQAVQNHPLIRAGQYAALAAGETVREARSAYFPTAYGSITGAQAQDGTRIAAGGLNNPI